MNERPPLGIMPRLLWEEQRFNDLKGAILRRIEVDKELPSYWIEEYNELRLRVCKK